METCFALRRARGEIISGLEGLWLSVLLSWSRRDFLEASSVVFTIPITEISSPSAVSSTSTSCIRMPSFRSKLTMEDAVLSRAGFGGA